VEIIIFTTHPEMLLQGKNIYKICPPSLNYKRPLLKAKQYILPTPL